MVITNHALLEAIESGFFLLPDVPEFLESLTVPGVRGRITSVSHPLANLVGAAALDQQNADSAIKQVFEIFSSQHKAFGWVIGPLSTPQDLGERLTGAGLMKLDEMAGLALLDLSIPIRTNPAVRIRETTPDDLAAASGMMGRAYGLPDDVAQLLSEVVLRNQSGVRIRGYLASMDDSEEPVAFSFLTYIPDQPIILLGGAATLPQHRGKGIYSSMVARRLADARADGAQAAVIQAVRSTSAPICQKFGFEELGALDLYGWIPQTTKS